MDLLSRGMKMITIKVTVKKESSNGMQAIQDDNTKMNVGFIQAYHGSFFAYEWAEGYNAKHIGDHAFGYYPSKNDAITAVIGKLIKVTLE